MADPRRDTDSDDTGVGPDRAASAGTPRWVYVFGIIAVAVILLFVILLLVGGGHSPRRHTSSGDDTPPLGRVEYLRPAGQSAGGRTA